MAQGRRQSGSSVVRWPAPPSHCGKLVRLQLLLAASSTRGVGEGGGRKREGGVIEKDRAVPLIQTSRFSGWVACAHLPQQPLINGRNEQARRYPARRVRHKLPGMCRTLARII